MLEKLLRLAAETGTARASEFAQALGLSPPLIRSMLDMLTEWGYLKAVVPECSTPCEQCPLHAACLFRSQPRVWALTRKGKRFLDRAMPLERALK
jgi:predicted ArsR family transcriptional regulator